MFENQLIIQLSGDLFEFHTAIVTLLLGVVQYGHGLAPLLSILRPQTGIVHPQAEKQLLGVVIDEKDVIINKTIIFATILNVQSERPLIMKLYKPYKLRREVVIFLVS